MGRNLPRDDFFKRWKKHRENLIVASTLFISHFLAHYFVLQFFYIIYQNLLELGNRTIIAKFVQTIGEAPLKDYPHYPPFTTYLLIILAGDVGLIILFPILAGLFEFIIFKVYKLKLKLEIDETNFASLISSYLIVYFLIVSSLTKSMLIAWSDYGELFVELLLIAGNFAMKRHEYYIRRKFPLNLQQIQYYQQYLGRLSTLFMQGLSISIAVLTYTIFYAFNSFPDEVKQYPEYFESMDTVIIQIGVYLSIFIWNVYRLAKLEFDVVSQTPDRPP